MPVLSSNWDIFENLDLEIKDLTVNQDEWEGPLSELAGYLFITQHHAAW